MSCNFRCWFVWIRCPIRIAVRCSNNCTVSDAIGRGRLVCGRRMRSGLFPLVKSDLAHAPAGIDGVPAQSLSRFAVLARVSTVRRQAAPRVRAFNMGCWPISVLISHIGATDCERLSIGRDWPECIILGHTHRLGAKLRSEPTLNGKCESSRVWRQATVRHATEEEALQ